MEDEITVKPLVDILSRQLGKQVVMSGDNYVLMSDKSVVAAAVVELALATQQNDLLQAETEKALALAKSNGEIYTLNGVGYQVPFMKDDADGLMQVKVAFEMGVLATNIHFSNGTVMPISSVDFPTFGLWYVEKRNSFFI